MIQPFNDLSPAQVEVLSLLAEEAAEVVQDVNKILRHGLYSFDPTKQVVMWNIHHLCKELGDMEAAKALCSKYIHQFNRESIESAKQDKLRSIDQWLHHVSASGLFVPKQPPDRPRAPGEPTEEQETRERMARALRGDIT